MKVFHVEHPVEGMTRTRSTWNNRALPILGGSRVFHMEQFRHADHDFR